MMHESSEKLVTISTKPTPLEIDLSRTALVVVDMQNAFASKGGMFDLLGMDLSGVRPVIENIKRLSDAVRDAGAKIIYLTMGYEPDMWDSGGPESPNWHKEGGVVELRKNPQLRDKLLIRGTWGERIVDELKPSPGDFVVPKSRYSGFCSTKLDLLLRNYGIKYLLFSGIATNVCVESTIRDAFFRDYWPILITDCAGNAGPSITQQATIWNVQNVFGWVATTDDVLKAINELKAIADENVSHSTPLLV